MNNGFIDKEHVGDSIKRVENNTEEVQKNQQKKKLTNKRFWMNDGKEK